jgi:hypothetical protein
LILAGHTAPGAPRSWYRDWAAWTLLLLGLGFLFSGWIQLFPIPGWVDAGMYQGYGLNFPNLVSRYGLKATSYHGSRLPYVLVLYSSHRLASPEGGQYLQVLFFYLLSVLSLLELGYRRFGRGPALVAGAFLVGNPLFLSALTFGGADGAALAYVALTLALLFCPSGLEGQRGALLAAGAAGASACAAHPFAVPALAGILLAYPLSAFGRGWELRRCAYLGLGGVLALLAWGAIGTTLGLKFLFLEYSLQMTRRMAGGFGAAYFKPLSEWLWVNYRVLVPVVLGGGLAALLLAPRSKPDRDRCLGAALVASLLPYSLYLWLDLSGRFPALQARFYFTPLLPSLVLCVLVLARKIDLGHSARSVPVLAALLGLPAALLGAGLVSPPVPRPEVARPVFWLVLTLGGVLALLIVFARRAGRERASSLLAMAALVHCAACLALSEDSLQVFRVRTGQDYKEVYLGASRLIQVLEDSPVAARLPMFWFDRKKVNARDGLASTYYLRLNDKPLHLNYIDSLISYYLWEPVMLGTSLQAVDEGRLARVAGRPIVFLGPDRASCEEALARVRALGHRVELLYWLAHPAERFPWVAAVFEAKAPAEP